jgi:hypothetical protein
MEKKDDGGQALVGFELRPDGAITLTSQLSIRDYFAAAALQGLLSGNAKVPDNFAQRAFAAADTMLEARKK